jgi:hypothetical protein
MNSQSAAIMLGGQRSHLLVHHCIVISALPNSRFDPCTPDKENSARDFAPGQEAKGIGVLLCSDLQRIPDNH